MGGFTPHRYAFINLPHAQTILDRLLRRLLNELPPVTLEGTALPDLLTELDRLLRPHVEDPPEAVAVVLADQAAALARCLVDEIEQVGCGSDRVGQCVRNLFECLGLAAEGAELSLRCGERPDSPLRP
ncbi:MAG: hypothetical protein HY653_07825 [Acidobacteria bacterium]|nr:hypothetical protein [Acidobacteriota bacterium]